MACPRSSAFIDAGVDDGGFDDGSSLDELLELAVDGMEAQAQVTERVCECGFFCGNIRRLTPAQASCFFAQAAGDVETFRLYFETVTAYSNDVVACYEDMGCVRPETCALAPPDIVRNPPAFYVRSLSVCL